MDRRDSCGIQPPVIHTTLDASIKVDDIIEIGVVLTHESYQSPMECLLARVNEIDWENSEEAYLNITLLTNHEVLDRLQCHLTTEDVNVDLFVLIGDEFDTDIEVGDWFAEEMFHQMDLYEAQNFNKRKSAAQRVYEEACIDYEIAARVCHSVPGIKTRNSFYRKVET